MSPITRGYGRSGTIVPLRSAVFLDADTDRDADAQAKLAAFFSGLDEPTIECDAAGLSFLRGFWRALQISLLIWVGLSTIGYLLATS
jgi:hypothetical protein